MPHNVSKNNKLNWALRLGQHRDSCLAC